MNFSSSESTHREAPVTIARETEHPGRHAQEGCQDMCFDPLDPAGEVGARSAGCTISMSAISPLVFIAAGRSIESFQKQKNAF